MLQSKPSSFAAKSKSQELGRGLTEGQSCSLAVGSNLLQRGYGTERVNAGMHVTLDVQVHVQVEFAALKGLYACNLAGWARSWLRMRARFKCSTTHVHNPATCSLQSSRAIGGMRNLRDLNDVAARVEQFV